MSTRRLPILLLIVFSAVTVQAADRPNSALEVGASAVPFLVRDCTGPAAGKRLCYMCRYGTRPVVTIFARQIDETAAKFVKLIDNSVKEHGARRLAAFVVLVDTDTSVAEKKLKALAAEQRISQTPLTIFNDQSSKLITDYGLSDDVPFTVMLWRGARLEASHRWGDGQRKADFHRRIAMDLARILE